MATITTLLGEMDESQLQRLDTVIENAVEHTEIVEYCLRDCKGLAHVTGQPQGDGCFCPHHVHRSVNMRLKQGVAAISAVQGF